MSLEEFQQQRIEAMEIEIARLNNELRMVKDVAYKVRLSDPNFDKPLSDLEIDFEIIKPEQ